MMQSNQPYQRVKNHDPLYNSIAIGAASGAAGMGAIHGSARLMKKHNKFFGNSWKRAGVYAAATVVGAGLGAGIDYMTD